MTTNASQERKLEGVLGFFDDPRSIVQAMEKVRDANYADIDAFTPFAVHGLEHAQGLDRSPIPWITLGAGITGFCIAFALQYWTSAVDWPLNVAGKPFNSWPAWIPILFELTVLVAGLATLAALIFFCRLPNTKRRAFDPSLTNDRFAILIGSNDAAGKKGKTYKPFDAHEAQDFLRKVGAKDVRPVYEEGWF